MLSQDILQDCGIAVTRHEAVHGGDINKAYCLYGNGQKYFLKINNAERYSGMFEKEARGLQALAQNIHLTVPAVIKFGSLQGEQYLLMEWIDTSPAKKDCWQNFGAALALLHKKPATYFGWIEDNFIGSVVQCNHQQTEWHLFYGECRILPLVKHLVDAGVFSKNDMIAAEAFCKRLEQLFPVEPPALLHGDLWSGNYMITTSGYAAIFDPAVYCGHREMDIGMTKLFGGFAPYFYNAYNEAYPLEKDWQQRLPYTQLYPLLVHSLLFGGNYVATVKEIMGQFH
ncbi:MAG: fructosamine kinase family protein [Ferruginibacter sp.]